MAKREETFTVEKEKIYYECDKCYGRNHEETQMKESLNEVVFGAVASRETTIPANTYDAHTASAMTSREELRVSGEYKYLLCDECMERAHDYLSDFF